MEGVEFYGSISLLKAGLQFADRITTVSPTYAAEIRTADAGMGFDGLLRARASVLSGILNGIDTTVWNPASDMLIDTPFDRTSLAKRASEQGRAAGKDGPRRRRLGTIIWGRQPADLAERAWICCCAACRCCGRSVRNWLWLVPANRKSRRRSEPKPRMGQIGSAASSDMTRRWRTWCRPERTWCWSPRASNRAA